MGGRGSEKLARGVRVRTYASGLRAIEIQFQSDPVVILQVGIPGANLLQWFGMMR